MPKDIHQRDTAQQRSSRLLLAMGIIVLLGALAYFVLTLAVNRRTPASPDTRYTAENGISVYYESAVWPVCEMTEDATLGRALELASAQSSDDAKLGVEGDGHDFERKAEVLPQPRETDGQSYAVLAARNAHQNPVAGGQHLVLLDGFAHQAAEPLHRFRVAHDRLTLSTRLTMSLMEASLVRPET